ncbi:ImmA/IrrE family metallo-endopeptidase [Lacticaseibacillus mingshuiensis]|uniref:ImmA/IrrE family metallo-endopeptidase n=1 Tax=Lacticaseibacillus mingshuiensis TaxID=2799574 RepID=UPI00194EF68F|nr:ImmA/IrrE family metallo-endopeptidase [Lacticaseibacillus mingshuiensis]
MNTDLAWTINYALDHDIGVQICDWNPEWSSCSIAERHTVFINQNAHEPEELPFVTAHEVGHILNGDSGQNFYSLCGNINGSKREAAADKTGIRILFKRCTELEDFDPAYFNPVQFMESYCIPESYYSFVRGLIRDER